MPVGTTATEYRSLETEDLVEKLKEAKEELFNLRFQAATGQLENHGRFFFNDTATTEIYTVLRERELGITSVETPEDVA